MKKFKKVIALTLACAMLLGISLAAQPATSEAACSHPTGTFYISGNGYQCPTAGCISAYNVYRCTTCGVLYLGCNYGHKN